MKILHSLYYYRPHYSGLTVYTERLAIALARQGHQVTILTSRYDSALPPVEELDGVLVKRLPVVIKISKGPIMPTLLFWVLREGQKSDVIHLHVPQLDAAPIALIGRILRKPVILTYHCDLRLPKTPLNRVANWLSALANRISVGLADIVVANARDYAEASPILHTYRHKLEVIPPPIAVAEAHQKAHQALRERLNIKPGQKIIGMVARLASEKGVEYLVEALPLVKQVYPEARVLYVGQHEDVMGEQAYAQRLMPMIDALGEAWAFLGNLNADELCAFYAVCDLTVLPSLNSTESFGMVQVESMLCGTPVVSSDLPGVRQPVLQTGMGEIVLPGSGAALAEGIQKILASPEAYRRKREEIERRFSQDVIAKEYARIYLRAIQHKQDSKAK